MAGKEKSAGRVLLIPKGVFTIGTNYTPLDFVAFGSNNYVCKKATDGTKTPVEDTASWQMLAAGFDSHNIAAEYSEKATYHSGDICISGGNLYKAKQDINAAEAFTAGHWEEITVGQELTSLETTKADASDVTTLKEKVGTTALTTTAADLSGAVNEVKTATDTNASAITKLNSDLKSGLFIGKKRYSKSDYASLAAMIAKLCDDGYTCGMFDVIGMPEFNSQSWTYYILFYVTHDNRMVAVQAYRMFDRSIMMNTLKHDNTWNFPDWTTI